MTSSGTYNWGLSNAEAVFAAFERVQIRMPELRQEHMATARRELNDLFVELSNRQVNLWKVQLNTVSLTAGIGTYTLPSNVVMVLDAYRSVNYGATNQTDIYTTPISRTEYATYAAKTTPGPPIVYWFDRTITPTVTFYPYPDPGGPYTWAYYAAIQIQDANLPGGETPDLPYRWLGVLVAGLALRLARCYPPSGIDPIAFKADRQADYDKAWMYAAGQDTENVNFSLGVALDSYYRR